ncbi:MAG: hypothetical protein H7Z13_11190 [Ferruginibacter sp.]|nr:hypothetical protein [Ferruginibacter sp.]
MLKNIITTISCLAFFTGCFGQLQPSWKTYGQLKTRPAKHIKSSTWSIGGETLDRDYTDYQSYKKYLGPLGAKRIRLQAGWAKCEKEKGQYNFKWLDSVVNDARSQEVQPWLQLSYGNPIYAGGGDAQLAGGIPSSPEALMGWDNWARALVAHFKDRVFEWEIWNEPDLGKKFTAEDFADFYIRTTEIVRSEQPSARLLAMAVCVVSRLDFIEPLFKKLQAQDKHHLVDIFTYHGYSANPDDSYPGIEKMRALVWKYNPKVQFMQGENGAPSTPKAITIGALREFEWSELTQAKWDLRRMLGDHGRGIATNLFTISDITYAPGDHMVGVNSKGLLKTNADKTVDRPKMAYKAAQHVFSLFDDQVILNPSVKLHSNGSDQSMFSYQYAKNGRSLITIWQSEARPSDNYAPKLTTLTVEGGQFKKPVLVDLVTGKSFEIPAANWKVSGTGYIFSEIPVPDYPVLIVDKSILKLKK